jgi:hypothetical protein
MNLQTLRGEDNSVGSGQEKLATSSEQGYELSRAINWGKFFD